MKSLIHLIYSSFREHYAHRHDSQRLIRATNHVTIPFRRALWGLQILVLAVGCLSGMADDALAAKRKRAPVGDVLPKKYSAIVVDAGTGRVLEETSAKALRHPASLTKIMTLYVVFAQ